MAGHPSPSRTSTTGVILAGGRARRMDGQDKGLMRLGGRPLIEWAIETLAPQVDSILISANRNLERYSVYGHTLVCDLQDGFQGPLAGYLAAMVSASSHWILTLPCDAPLAPADLRERLATSLAREQAEIAIASDGKRLQPLHALIPISLAADVEQFLTEGGRKVADWQQRHRLAIADFSDRPQHFINVNTHDELSALERSLSTGC